MAGRLQGCRNHPATEFSSADAEGVAEGATDGEGVDEGAGDEDLAPSRVPEAPEAPEAAESGASLAPPSRPRQERTAVAHKQHNRTLAHGQTPRRILPTKQGPILTKIYPILCPRALGKTRGPRRRRPFLVYRRSS